MKRPVLASNVRSYSPARSGRGLVANLVVALVLGSFQVLMAISLAAMVFSGELAPFLARGIGFTLVGSTAVAVAIALFSSLPGTFGGSQNSTGAILAVIAAQIAVVAGSRTAAADTAGFVTAVVAITLTSLVTGAFLLALGRFKLGNLVRFLPFPIVGGFLAGTGWLLSVAALDVMSGTEPRLHEAWLLFAPEVAVRWLPGLVLALAMMGTVARVRHPLALPGVIAGALLLFYTATWSAGTSLVELTEGGWLLGPFPDGNLWQPLSLAELGGVEWAAILRQLPAMLTIPPVAAVALLLSAGGIELVKNQEASLNRELSAAGVANLLAAAGSGLVGFHQVGVTSLGAKLGVTNRNVVLLAAALLALTLFSGATGLSLLPRFLMGGMLLYIGLGFLYTWLVEAWWLLPRLEFAVVVAIVIVIASVGFLEGVALGVVAALVLFVVMYSRIDVVRHELSGVHAASRVNRSPAQREVLAGLAPRIRVLHLHGFIFFGTAEMLLRRVRERLHAVDGAGDTASKDGAERASGAPNSGIRFLVLDFRRVTGLDSTATHSFTKMRQIATASGVTLVLTDVPASVRDALIARGAVDDDSLRFMPHLDSGLEWCEDQLLKGSGVDDGRSVALEASLPVLLPDEPGWPDLLPYLERRTLNRGELLIRQGEAPDRMFFVEEGSFTAQLERPGTPPLRLETMGGGSILGELGFFLRQPRSASVVADDAGVVHCLDLDALDRMQRHDPQVALALHRLIVRSLASRVGHLMGVVQELER